MEISNDTNRDVFCIRSVSDIFHVKSKLYITICDTLCWEHEIMMLFTRRKDGRKRWREKALLINPHKTRIVFVAGGRKTARSHPPPWIHKKLEEFARTLDCQDSDWSPRTTVPEFVFADRVRQENQPGHLCDSNIDHV